MRAVPVQREPCGLVEETEGRYQAPIFHGTCRVLFNLELLDCQRIHICGEVLYVLSAMAQLQGRFYTEE